MDLVLYTGRDSIKIEEEKLERIRGKLFPALDRKTGLVLWIENMESKTSAIYQFKLICNAEAENDKIICKVYKALDKNNESTWKEAISTEEMLELKATIGEIEFEKQMQQNPIMMGKIIKKEWFKYFDPDDYKAKKIKKYLWSDPGGDSDKKTVCEKAVVLIGFDGSKYLVYRVVNGHMNLRTFVHHHYDIYEDEKDIEKMYMEDNFFQNLLFRWFDDAVEDRGYILPIRGKSSRVNKWLRIEQLLPLIERGKILFNKKDPYLARFIEQAVAYEGEGQKHPVDALDAVGSCVLLFGKGRKQSKIKVFKAKKLKSRK